MRERLIWIFLLYGNQEIKTDRLVVPHNEIENRNFVLIPLFQISPELEIPGKGILKNILNNVSDQALEKVSEFNGKA